MSLGATAAMHFDFPRRTSAKPRTRRGLSSQPGGAANEPVGLTATNPLSKGGRGTCLARRAGFWRCEAAG